VGPKKVSRLSLLSASRKGPHNPFYLLYLYLQNCPTLSHDLFRASPNSRLSELWSHAYRSRQQFEAEPSTGIIGKGIARPFNLVWNYVVKAALGTALLCCVIPAATALNALVSLGVIVTSPLWAPAFTLLQYLWEVLIFDGVTNRLSPLVIALFWGLGVTGLGNIALSLVLAVLHPVIGAVIYVGGGLGIGVVAVWDWLMFWGLLRWHARIPSSDTFLCRRISGGGIVETQTYFVQVRG
jgi:hypothetical protein